MSDRIEQDKYLLVAAELQNHVSRLNHKSQDEQPLDSLRITFEKEYPFIMAMSLLHNFFFLRLYCLVISDHLLVIANYFCQMVCRFGLIHIFMPSELNFCQVYRLLAVYSE